MQQPSYFGTPNILKEMRTLPNPYPEGTTDHVAWSQGNEDATYH
jgi:hypothetical protein